MSTEADDLVISALVKAVLAESPTDDIAEALYTWPPENWTDEEREAMWFRFGLSQIAKRKLQPDEGI